jgi:hypothetical protein
LTYRGGASTILCPDTDITMGLLRTIRGAIPSADLILHSGRALTDTATPSAAFNDLEAAIALPGGVATNQGPAWYAAGLSGVEVSAGKVAYTGTGAVTEGDANPIGCGDGTVVERPSGPPAPAPTGTALPSVTSEPTVTTTATAATATVPGSTGKPPSTSVQQSTTRSTVDTTPPTIGRLNLQPPTVLAQIPPVGSVCGGAKATDTTLVVTVPISDAPGGSGPVRASLTWKLNVDGSGDTINLAPAGSGLFSNSGAPLTIAWQIGHANGGAVAITIHATDGAGNQATPVSATVSLDLCLIAVAT